MTLAPASDRLSNLQFTVGLAGQHAVELDLLADRHVAVIDVQFLALFDPKLASAFGDDCVHGTDLRAYRVLLANNSVYQRPRRLFKGT